MLAWVIMGATWRLTGDYCLHAQINTVHGTYNGISLANSIYLQLMLICSHGKMTTKCKADKADECWRSLSMYKDRYVFLPPQRATLKKKTLQLLQVNDDLILCKSIPCCQPTTHVCQKIQNQPWIDSAVNAVDWGSPLLKVWSLKAQETSRLVKPSRSVEGISHAAAFPHGRCWGRDDRASAQTKENCSMLTSRLYAPTSSLSVWTCVHLKC